MQLTSTAPSSVVPIRGLVGTIDRPGRDWTIVADRLVGKHEGYAALATAIDAGHRAARNLNDAAIVVYKVGDRFHLQATDKLESFSRAPGVPYEHPGTHAERAIYVGDSRVEAIVGSDLVLRNVDRSDEYIIAYPRTSS